MTRPHGRTKYVLEKCRCDVCKADARAYERQRRQHNAQAAWGAVEPLLIDSAPVRAHIDALASYGIGAKRLAELSGVSRAVIARLRGWSNGVQDNRPADRVRPATAAKLLAVTRTPENARPGALLDALGSGRKLRGLHAIGWPISDLGRRLHFDRADIGRLILVEPGNRITAKRVIAIDGLYQQLCMTPGPSPRATAHALSLGWAPPLAWDDIDDPACQPHGQRQEVS